MAKTPTPEESMSTFEWSCKCLNVTLRAREERGEGSKGEGKKRVWLPEGAELIVHPVYVGYKQTAAPGDRTSRRCYVCSTKLYLPAELPRTQDAHVGWVEVDLTGVLYGEKLKEAQDKPRLPLSDLLVNLPGPSTFGRPPPTLPTSSASTSQAIVSLLPPMPDPFFLPPPFVPSHPHLHSLILHAVDQLKASRSRLENDVTSYMEAKTKEMQQEEDRIRAEVEFLWNAYQKGPGKKENKEKPAGRRASVTEEKTAQLARPVVQAPTSGLLGASLSANTFYAPSNASYPDELPELDLSGATVGSGSVDDRNLAVSLMVSHLEQQKLGNASSERVRPGRSSSKSRQSRSRERPITVQEEEETEPVATPRTERKTVKFQEPESVEAESLPESTTEDVFDFEEHDAAAPADSRTRTQLDTKLSSTLAVDTPSHRSAWRQIEQSQSIYDSFRTRQDDRRRTDSDSESEATPTNPSMFATSMPVHIAMPKIHRKPENLEPKTSLTERPGLLVPGLRAAMRENPARGNVLGLDVPADERSTSRDRSASISGTFKQDPGAVFEALADEDELGEIDDASTRPGRPNFVPPHIQSLQDDIADSLVGWRSLAT